uniref:Uncharacterized protein n=2 Tax=Oryza sativa subsp. japonica TaxID=39947 RepID=Q2R7L5_ORYSJ|nr:hypothetical protein LOC_Os11g15710 [Oryza sativa Japonica Group]ABA92475.1 hypothetical protein LOC_Os11g15710 [Oryza sativa Japonica Group]
MEQLPQPPSIAHTELLCRPYSSLLSFQPQRVDAGAVETDLDHTRDGHEWVEEGEANEERKAARKRRRGSVRPADEDGDEQSVGGHPDLKKTLTWTL